MGSPSVLFSFWLSIFADYSSFMSQVSNERSEGVKVVGQSSRPESEITLGLSNRPPTPLWTALFCFSIQFLPFRTSTFRFQVRSLTSTVRFFIYESFNMTAYFQTFGSSSLTHIDPSFDLRVWGADRQLQTWPFNIES